MPIGVVDRKSENKPSAYDPSSAAPILPPDPPAEDVNTTLLLESKAKNLVLAAVPADNPVRLSAEAVRAFVVVFPLSVT